MSPLKKMRLAQGRRLLDLAQVLGVAEATYSRKERGELPITPAEAEQLAGELGYPLTEMHILFPERFADFDPHCLIEN